MSAVFLDLVSAMFWVKLNKSKKAARSTIAISKKIVTCAFFIKVPLFYDFGLNLDVNFGHMFTPSGNPETT